MRFLTAGESHGKGLTIVIDGFPAGVDVSSQRINHDLARRQVGYGRGGRMKIETDEAEILAGIRFGQSTGAPISLFIQNRDFKNWETVMAAQGDAGKAADEKSFHRPRPGHADLAGYYKYNHHDLRNVLERASARETAARVAAGAVAKELLLPFNIRVMSHVRTLGGIKVPDGEMPLSYDVLQEVVEQNDLRCAGSEKTLEAMRNRVDAARKDGTTLGGEIEVIVTHLPPGLGTYAQWDRRLDGLLAQAVMSIQAVKSVTIGAGDEGQYLEGTDFHDAIVPGAITPGGGQNNTLTRPTNRAGGLEGGVTNGMPLVVRAVMKPISTMIRPLPSLNLETGEPEEAHFERSDVTAVPACGVVAEAMVAWVLADAFLEKFGEDTLSDIQKAYTDYQSRLTPVPQSN